MADTTDIVGGRDFRGRFGGGNACARGMPVQRAVKYLRTRAIRYFKSDPGRLDRLLGTLEGIAMDPFQPAPARVAAIKELLARALGNPDQTFNINAAIGKQVQTVDPVEYGRRALELGLPWSKLPPEVQCVTPRPIEATVSDAQK